MINNASISTEKIATRDVAEELCRNIYENLKDLGFYPALTGGLLYKGEARKDIDIVIFRNRQKIQNFEMKEIEMQLRVCGLSEFKYYGFVTKCRYKGVSVDLFNPETSIDLGDEYYD